MDPTFHNLEQQAGPPDCEPVEASAVDAHRETVYRSYENYLREELARLEEERPARWNRDYSGEDAYAASVAPMRERFKAMLGSWVEPGDRDPVAERDEESLIEDGAFTARRFYFNVLPGLESYAVELVPKSAGPHPGLLVQHGYGGTPELVCGLCTSANEEDYSYRSLGLRAVRRGHHVIAIHHPTGYGTTADTIGSPAIPDFPQFLLEYGKNRLHRLALMAGGRSLLGLDMLACSRGVDLLLSRPGVDSVGMYGLSQGATSTLYAMAMDDRIKVGVASAWFSRRLFKMIGPHPVTPYLDTREEDKFFADMIPLFSDGDVVSLIAPRSIAIEAGEKDTSVNFEGAWEEFQQARAHYEELGIPERIEFIAHHEGHVSATARAFEFLAEHLDRE
jgi:hypothetical protein